MYKECFRVVGAWWADALNVNDEKGKIEAEVKKRMNYGGWWTKYLDFKMNGESMNEYDLLIRVFWITSKPKSGVLASAGPVLRHPGSQRPIIGNVNVYSFGDRNWTGKSALTTASDTMIHEFGHIISFSSWSSLQEQHIKLDTVLKKWIWTGPIVLQRAMKYYNCPTLAGVPLQTRNGRVGAHWDEDFLGVEMMTPSTMIGEHTGASVMTLALCEDTGWYKADYSMAENFTFKKNIGCNNWNKCETTCKRGTSGITPDYQAWGYCSSQGACGKYSAYSNRKCHNEKSWSSSYLIAGASYDSDCSIVQGTFPAYKNNYGQILDKISAATNCTSNNSEYNVVLKFSGSADVTVKCRGAGNVDFTAPENNKGHVSCEDPIKFCKARFEATEGCPGRCGYFGRCANQGKTLQMAQMETFNRSKMLGVGRKITIMSQSEVIKPWQCWCYNTTNFSTQADGSCPVDTTPVTPATPTPPPVTPATPTPPPVTPAAPAPAPAPVTPATPTPGTPAGQTPTPVTPANPAPVTPGTGDDDDCEDDGGDDNEF